MGNVVLCSSLSNVRPQKKSIYVTDIPMTSFTVSRDAVAVVKQKCRALVSVSLRSVPVF